MESTSYKNTKRGGYAGGARRTIITELTMPAQHSKDSLTITNSKDNRFNHKYSTRLRVT